MNAQKTPLVKPIKVFPITRTVVLKGVEYNPTLNHGDKVSCYYCGKPIRVNSRTAVTVNGDPTNMQYIECPECHMRVSVLYYFDRRIPKVEKKTKKARKRTRAYVSGLWSNDDANGKL